MREWTAILRRHPVVRACAAALFLYGVAGAATSPFQSVVAIRELGLSDRAYAGLALASAVANVMLAIGVGMLSDRFRSYRRPLIFVTAFGVLGYGMVWAFPSAQTFALAVVGPLAVFHATNSLLFGTVRAQTARLDPAEAAIITALMRIMISLAWVVVPGVTGLLLGGQDSMIPAFLIAALLAGGCMMTVVFWLAPDHMRPAEAIPMGGTGTARIAPSTGRTDRPAQVRLAQGALHDLRLILSPRILTRVLGVALISQVLHVNAAVLPLIVTGQAGGKTADIGYLVGMVAVLEVIFMVFWARASLSMALARALMINAALYLVYLTAIALADAPWQVYAASLIAGFSAAAIVSLPIGYLLDLIQDRPGLSASLIAVNMFAGGALGAGVFALGTALGGYPLAAILSGVFGTLGAGLLVVLERGRR